MGNNKKINLKKNLSAVQLLIIGALAWIAGYILGSVLGDFIIVAGQILILFSIASYILRRHLNKKDKNKH